MADPASELERSIAAFRRRLIALDRQASQLLSAAYDDILRQLQTRLDALETLIADRIASGQPVSPDWLFRQDRYRLLIRQTETLITQYGGTVQTVVTSAQTAVIRASLIEAGAQLAAVSGGSGEIAQIAAGWARVPDDAITQMVAALQESTPLGRLLGAFGDDAVKQVNAALVRGLGLGLGGREVAREVEQALGITRARAETIVRTETLRASRGAMSAAFQDSGVVQGKRWNAAKSARSCGYCLSMDGTIHPIDAGMATHQNCRCSWAPWLGDGLDSDWETGEDWLKRQKPNVQASVLGKKGYQEFKAGNVQLSDFRRTGFDAEWGPFGNDGGIAHALRQAKERTV